MITPHVLTNASTSFFKICFYGGVNKVVYSAQVCARCMTSHNEFFVYFYHLEIHVENAVDEESHALPATKIQFNI